MKTFAGLLCVAVLCPYFCVRRSSLIFLFTNRHFFIHNLKVLKIKKFDCFQCEKPNICSITTTNDTKKRDNGHLDGHGHCDYCLHSQITKINIIIFGFMHFRTPIADMYEYEHWTQAKVIFNNVGKINKMNVCH